MHPRYQGPVIDAHLHFDRSTAPHAPAVIARAGLAGAIHFWDIAWPPPRFEDEAAWADAIPGLHRCHVPDLSAVGAPGGEQALGERVRAAAAAGAVGVKLWKNLGLWLCDTAGARLAVTDPRLEPLWEAAADTGLPVVIHQGDAPAFFAPLDDANPRRAELESHPDWWYGGGDFPPLAQIHAELEAVVAAQPRTTFVGLHFGCFMDWPDVDRMLGAYPNYHVDTATTIADMGRDDAWEAVRAIILAHPDRVIFGTDLIRTAEADLPGGDGGWGDVADPRRWELDWYYDRHWDFFETGATGLPLPLPVQGDWTITGLDLPDAVLARLYHDNARAIFGLA